MVRSFNLSYYKNSIWRGREYTNLWYKKKKTETIPVEGTVVWWWQSLTFFSNFSLSTIYDRSKFSRYCSISIPVCACGFGVLSLARERMAAENLTVIVFCLFLFSVSLSVSQASSPPSISISVCIIFLSLFLCFFPRFLVASLSLSSPLYFDLCVYGGAAKNLKFESEL